MSFPQATPARPIPGAFLNTPAIVQRFQAQAQQDPVRRQLFGGHHGHDEAQTQTQAQTQNAHQTAHHGEFAAGTGSDRDRDREAKAAATGLMTTTTTTTTAAMTASSLSALPPPRVESVPAVLKAARAVNAFLQLDESFPDLDSYCRQGASSDYELPSSDSAWAPFQKTNMYPIPNQVFDHYNTGQLQTLMGLFAELNHAWVVIDNSLFLWDYTSPDPELIGFEDQPHTIHAVALVPPKPGIFVASITHILVVATSSELILLGVSASDATTTTATTTTGSSSSSRNGTGGSGSGSGSGTGTGGGSSTSQRKKKSVALYQTKMVLPLRGNDIRVIKGSADGRIFFGGCSDTDISELYYQSEEKWFSNRCGRINHSNPGWSSVVTLQSVFAYRGGEPEHLVDIAIDDSRKLVYTLSSTSTIRTYHMEAPGRLTKVIEKTKLHCLRDIAHMISHSRLLDEKVSIVSVSPISKHEAVKLHLMALTDTGCRLFFSATNASSYLYYSSSQGSLAPQSMQVQFIKFPPSSSSSFARRNGFSSSSVNGEMSVDLESTTLVASRQGARFAPGFFLDFVTRSADSSATDSLFIAGPETGRIKRTSPTVPTRYFENASWIDIGSRAEAVGLITKPFAASQQPLGFGNELAVQFDEPPTEFAVLTNTGVHVIRRRRLVDTFAAAIRDSPGDDALDLMCRRLIQLYGRVETVSTALAVACGHGSDSPTHRPGSVRALDQATEDRARALFVDFGGQPTIVETDGSGALTTDSVKLSSRHDALVLYLSRLIRQLWKTAVIQPQLAANGTLKIVSAVDPAKLASVQENLERLRRFIDTNKGLIQGMAGPSELQRVVVVVGSRQEEVALQAEHQALHSLQKLMESISEGISFVLMLFDERVSDIFARLDDAARQQFRELTYEKLFSQADGKELAKLLVKAVVNRNIESGSNVETVADALRRRCGSFCSPDDVITFKAQEQLKRASEQPLNTNQSRVLLNESLTLFKKVAGSLTLSNLQAAAGQYVDLKYYAGAIQLCLTVARECDRGNAALMWINDGRPAHDPRLAFFRERRRAYDLIHEVLTHLDAASSAEPLAVDGRPTLMATKRNEAYDVVNGSDDEVFHLDLYEWYVEQGWTERILSIDSPHVVTFLQRLATTNFEHADLLCRFYTNRSRFFDAAEVQAELAASEFQIGIKGRIQLLSLAKANANVATLGVSRQQQSRVSHAVTNMLEIANIQDDLLGRIMADDRFGAERKMELAEKLDGKALTLSELFNDFADQAGYHDLCLVIYHTANYRNPTTISGTWAKLIKQTHEEVMAKRESEEQQQQQQQQSSASISTATLSATGSSSSVPWPYEAVTSKIRTIAHHTSLDSFVFPIQDLLPQLYRYAVTYRQDASIGASPTWPVQLFLSLGISHAMIVRVLETLFDTQDYGFSGAARNRIVEGIAYVVGEWVAEVRRRGGAGAGAGKGTMGGLLAGGEGGVGELLGRCEAALGGGNQGGAEVGEVRRVLRTLKREVAGLAERVPTGSRFM